MPVAIVNQSFADTFFPGQEAIGRSVRGTGRGVVGPWRTIVGVVPNVMHGDALRQEFKPMVYVPMRQDPDPRGVKSGGTGFRGSHFLLRTRVSPTLLAQTVLARIQALAPDVILRRLRHARRTASSSIAIAWTSSTPSSASMRPWRRCSR